jgi:hypothetical protein
MLHKQFMGVTLWFAEILLQSIWLWLGFIYFQETDVTIERCKEIIVVYEPQPEMKKAEKMSLIGEFS